MKPDEPKKLSLKTKFVDISGFSDLYFVKVFLNKISIDSIKFFDPLYDFNKVTSKLFLFQS